MSCSESLIGYGLRAFGYGERLLPKNDIIPMALMTDLLLPIPASLLM